MTPGSQTAPRDNNEVLSASDDQAIESNYFDQLNQAFERELVTGNYRQNETVQEIISTHQSQHTLIEVVRDFFTNLDGGILWLTTRVLDRFLGSERGERLFGGWLDRYEMLAHPLQAARERLSETYQSVRETATDAYQTVRDTATGALDSARETASETFGTAATTLGAAADTASETFDEVIDNISDHPVLAGLGAGFLTLTGVLFANEHIRRIFTIPGAASLTRLTSVPGVMSAFSRIPVASLGSLLFRGGLAGGAIYGVYRGYQYLEEHPEFLDQIPENAEQAKEWFVRLLTRLELGDDFTDEMRATAAGLFTGTVDNIEELTQQIRDFDVEDAIQSIRDFDPEQALHDADDYMREAITYDGEIEPGQRTFLSLTQEIDTGLNYVFNDLQLWANRNRGTIAGAATILAFLAIFTDTGRSTATNLATTSVGLTKDLALGSVEALANLPIRVNDNRLGSVSALALGAIAVNLFIRYDEEILKRPVPSREDLLQEIQLFMENNEEWQDIRNNFDVEDDQILAGIEYVIYPERMMDKLEIDTSNLARDIAMIPFNLTRENPEDQIYEFNSIHIDRVRLEFTKYTEDSDEINYATNNDAQNMVRYFQSATEQIFIDEKIDLPSLEEFIANIPNTEEFRISITHDDNFYYWTLYHNGIAVPDLSNLVFCTNPMLSTNQQHTLINETYTGPEIHSFGDFLSATTNLVGERITNQTQFGIDQIAEELESGGNIFIVGGIAYLSTVRDGLQDRYYVPAETLIEFASNHSEFEVSQLSLAYSGSITDVTVVAATGAVAGMIIDGKFNKRILLGRTLATGLKVISWPVYYPASALRSIWLWRKNPNFRNLISSRFRTLGSRFSSILRLPSTSQRSVRSRQFHNLNLAETIVRRQEFRFGNILLNANTDILTRALNHSGFGHIDFPIDLSTDLGRRIVLDNIAARRAEINFNQYRLEALDIRDELIAFDKFENERLNGRVPLNRGHNADILRQIVVDEIARVHARGAIDADLQRINLFLREAGLDINTRNITSIDQIPDVIRELNERINLGRNGSLLQRFLNTFRSRTITTTIDADGNRRTTVEYGTNNRGLNSPTLRSQSDNNRFIITERTTTYPDGSSVTTRQVGNREPVEIERTSATTNPSNTPRASIDASNTPDTTRASLDTSIRPDTTSTRIADMHANHSVPISNLSSTQRATGGGVGAPRNIDTPHSIDAPRGHLNRRTAILALVATLVTGISLARSSSANDETVDDSNSANQSRPQPTTTLNEDEIISAATLEVLANSNDENLGEMDPQELFDNAGENINSGEYSQAIATYTYMLDNLNLEEGDRIVITTLRGQAEYDLARYVYQRAMEVITTDQNTGSELVQIASELLILANEDFPDNNFLPLWDDVLELQEQLETRAAVHELQGILGAPYTEIDEFMTPQNLRGFNRLMFANMVEEYSVIHRNQLNAARLAIRENYDLLINYFVQEYADGSSTEIPISNWSKIVYDPETNTIQLQSASVGRFANNLYSSFDLMTFFFVAEEALDLDHSPLDEMYRLREEFDTERLAIYNDQSLTDQEKAERIDQLAESTLLRANEIQTIINEAYGGTQAAAGLPYIGSGFDLLRVSNAIERGQEGRALLETGFYLGGAAADWFSGGRAGGLVRTARATDQIQSTARGFEAFRNYVNMNRFVPRLNELVYQNRLSRSIASARDALNARGAQSALLSRFLSNQGESIGRAINNYTRLYAPLAIADLGYHIGYQIIMPEFDQSTTYTESHRLDPLPTEGGEQLMSDAELTSMRALHDFIETQRNSEDAETLLGLARDPRIHLSLNSQVDFNETGTYSGLDLGDIQNETFVNFLLATNESGSRYQILQRYMQNPSLTTHTIRFIVKHLDEFPDSTGFTQKGALLESIAANPLTDQETLELIVERYRDERSLAFGPALNTALSRLN